MSEEEKDRLFREGVAAIRAGDKAAGREKLSKVVEVDQFHEQAWLWLSAVVETQEEKITCLQNALTINPKSEPARRGLAQMGVELEEPASKPAEAAPASIPAAAPAKPGEEWRADLYKGQPPASSADLSAGKLVSDATIVRIEEEVNRNVLDLANAWVSALIFKVAGDYREHVEDGPAGHILLNVSIAIVLQVLASIVFVVVSGLTGRDISGFVGSFNEMITAANQASAVGLVPAPLRPAVAYLEQQSGGIQFGTMDPEVVGSLTLVLAIYIVVSILFSFIGLLVWAMILNSVAARLGGKGGIIQTTQALTIAMVAYQIVALPVTIFGSFLPNTLLTVAYGGLSIYRFLQDAVAVDASHRIGLPASMGAVIIGAVLIVILSCCFGGALSFLLSL